MRRFRPLFRGAILDGSRRWERRLRFGPACGSCRCPQGTGFFGTVETSAFTVFFHVLICGIVLVALLLSLDTLPEDSHHQGEFYALVVLARWARA